MQAQGIASWPPHAQRDCSVPHSQPPSPSTPVPKAPGDGSSPEALACDPEQLAKENWGREAGPVVRVCG